MTDPALTLCPTFPDYELATRAECGHQSPAPKCMHAVTGELVMGNREIRPSGFAVVNVWVGI